MMVNVVILHDLPKWDHVDVDKEGPKIEPCGTPHVTFVDSDTKSPMETK